MDLPWPAQLGQEYPLSGYCVVLLLGFYVNPSLGYCVASLRGESSNQLLETLEEWNDYLERYCVPINNQWCEWTLYATKGIL